MRRHRSSAVRDRPAQLPVGGVRSFVIVENQLPRRPLLWDRMGAPRRGNLRLPCRRLIRRPFRLLRRWVYEVFFLRLFEVFFLRLRHGSDLRVFEVFFLRLILAASGRLWLLQAASGRLWLLQTLRLPCAAAGRRGGAKALAANGRHLLLDGFASLGFASLALFVGFGRPQPG